MKKEAIVLCIMMMIFCLTIFDEFFLSKMTDPKNNNQNTADVVYTDEYKESLRQNVIYELYGSRESYASENTGSRADYINKDASKGGELVVDEDRMQQVYDSKLKEFDSLIDNEEVDRIVNERLAQLVDEGTYNDLAVSNHSMKKRVMYWKNGGKYFAMVIEAGMILFLLFKIISGNISKRKDIN